MAIQMRRGNYADFDATKMVAGEFGICLDNGYVYITLAPGNAIRLGTADTIDEALRLVEQYRDEAVASAESAESDASDSEAYAVGQRDGEDVDIDDPTYHNNAKYYKEQTEYFSEHATYIYLRYSEYSDGTNFVTTPTSATKYMGIYSGNSSTAPTEKTGYSWVKFIGQDGTGGAVSDLTDVALTTLTDGQVLKYNSTTQKWENSSSAPTTSALDDLTNVNITTPSNNQVLKYNSTSEEWENADEEAQYTLPIASANTLGGIKVGSGLSINSSSGVLSNNYSLPTASSSTKGGIQVGTGFNMSGTTMNLNTATASSLGGVKVGNNLSISNGVLNYNLPTASASRLGGVMVKNNKGLSVDSSGSLSLDVKRVIVAVEESGTIAANKFKSFSSTLWENSGDGLPFSLSNYDYIPIKIFVSPDSASWIPDEKIPAIIIDYLRGSNCIAVDFTVFNVKSSSFTFNSIFVDFLVFNKLDTRSVDLSEYLIEE